MQILDLIRERKPPFSPEAVVEEFAKIIRSYRCTKVYGDRYGGEWPREQFRKHGVNYEPADKSKSAADETQLTTRLVLTTTSRTQWLALW